MLELQICSGCDNLVPLGVQYCDECEYEIALEDWLDSTYEDEEESEAYDDSEDPPLELFMENRGGGDI